MTAGRRYRVTNSTVEENEPLRQAAKILDTKLAALVTSATGQGSRSRDVAAWAARSDLGLSLWSIAKPEFANATVEQSFGGNVAIATTPS
jgi:hypothetical protein